jgi:hypothetical protein
MEKISSNKSEMNLEKPTTELIEGRMRVDLSTANCGNPHLESEDSHGS